jgi:3'-phosphoadenosine 5'-phosphosulfate sulfotransferase (PAPS reductase)/FAD synthetase
MTPPKQCPIYNKEKPKWKHTYKEYSELLKLPLKDKILRSEHFILYALKENNRPIVCNSWGKDSIVLLHLVRKFCKKVMIVYHDTEVDYPQNYVYRDLILKEWEIENYYESRT